MDGLVAVVRILTTFAFCLCISSKSPRSVECRLSRNDVVLFIIIIIIIIIIDVKAVSNSKLLPWIKQEVQMKGTRHTHRGTFGGFRSGARCKSVIILHKLKK
jgi:hypothetical protein